MNGPDRMPALRIFDALLILAAVGSLLASAAALAAESWWAFELFTHFRLQYAAVQLPLVVALLARRRFLWCVAVAAAVLPNALPVLPYWSHSAAGAAASAPSVEPITLIAVNVEARNTSHERLLDIVAAEDPDLLMVVEFTPAWRERLRPLYERFPYRVLHPRPDAFGVALLSRHPLEAVRTPSLESSPAVDARVLTPRGGFRLIGVHLRPPTARNSAAERGRQLTALAALLREVEEPVVVAGDFNLTPYSPYFRNFLRETELRDARGGFGPGISWPTFLPILGIPIDHCMVSSEFKVGGYRRLPAFGSDHYPILVELLLEPDS